MKKALLFVFMFICLSNVNSQRVRIEDSPNGQLGSGITIKFADTSNVTWSKVYNDVTGALSGLGAALKEGGSYAYKTFREQQIITSITIIIYSIVLLVIAIIFWKLFLKDRKRMSTSTDDWYNDSIEDHGVTIAYFVIAIAMTGAFIINLGVNIDSIFSGLLNPDYGAIKEIMDKIK